MKISPRIVCVVACLFMGFSSLLGTAAAVSASTEYPPIQLRGYGVLSGSSSVLDVKGTPASVLKITCESEEKAKLVQAKFLSDLQVLPGVKESVTKLSKGKHSQTSQTFASYEIEGQGVVVAAQEGTSVFLIFVQNGEALAELRARLFPKDISNVSFSSQAKVPMYLNRWDRHGFRFYYGPFTYPKGADGKPDKNYDPMKDIEFAKGENGCGLLVWQSPFPNEPAEGMMRTPMWDWVVRACEKAGIPTGVNTDAGKPCSIYNRYREQMFQRQPQYLGSYYGLLDADEGMLSWNATEARDEQLSQYQQTIRHYKTIDNVLSWLEPSGEMGHGAADNMIEYGPMADRGYREFLKEKYGTPQAVAKCWTGDEKAFASWDDVHVPEIASFLGWGKDAVDLTGTWRISHKDVFDPAQAAVGLDDSAWPTLVAPGHAMGMMLSRFYPKTPALYRRNIAIDPAWRTAHPKVWMYVWDLSDTRPRDGVTLETHAYLNGQALPEAEPAHPHTQQHWAAYDVSELLKAGDNQVTIAVPQGFFNYRAYFATEPPACYPELGEFRNAQWADFVDWGSWMRGNAVRRGAQMIRQVDPDRPIVFMSPDSYSGAIKEVCEDYGGVFHNTGYMAGCWADFHVMEMASIAFPTDLEPGSGAKDLPDFKRFLGRWVTEGIQGIDYFMHIGDVEWNPPIREYFHEVINIIRLIGKYHLPKAQIALLSSDRVNRLTGFPWLPDLKRFPLGGHWPVRLNELLRADYPRDEVFEADFARGHAADYKVIIDTSTSVMDDSFIAKIEKWVREGGIFVTFGHTGRHTSTHMDSWPISKLTGYQVLNYDKPARKFQVAPGQELPESLRGYKFGMANGLTLQKTAPECVDLVQWDDGSVAAGVRPLGKGAVIHLGAWFNNPDALRVFKAICERLNIAPIPATAEGKGLILRHYVSNNGLYDVWAIWNEREEPLKTELVFRNGVRPTSAIEVKTGQTLAVEQTADGAKLPMAFEPSETRVFLTPRSNPAAIATRWFELQRNWWRGIGDLGTPLPEFKPKFAVDLQKDWSFKPLEGTEASKEGYQLAAVGLDDAAWEKRDLGIFTIPDHPNVRHAIFRKTFTVPENWDAGRVELWIQEWHGGAYMDKGRTFLDGKALAEGSNAGAPEMDNTPVSDAGVAGDDLGGVLKPGTTHTLAVEIWGTNTVLGAAASAWLAYRPNPVVSQDLAGQWEPAPDALNYAAPVEIPGTYKGLALRRTVKIDADKAGKTAVLHVAATDRSMQSLLINGERVTRFHHYLGNAFDLNITPYLNVGGENEIILIGNEGKHTLERVALDYYEKGMYP